MSGTVMSGTVKSGTVKSGKVLLQRTVKISGGEYPTQKKNIKL